tara:strand:- start:42 stop:329 length:288 start_codon:yes stop_codon:yes gene_type:complete
MERIKLHLIHSKISEGRQRILKQFKESSEALINIEGDFLEFLFNEFDLRTYKELYSKYSVDYYLKAKELQESTSNVVEINLHYFIKYFPVEGAKF